MKKRDLGGESPKGGGNSVKFDLFDGGWRGGRGWVSMDHVV